MTLVGLFAWCSLSKVLKMSFMVLVVMAALALEGVGFNVGVGPELGF